VLQKALAYLDRVSVNNETFYNFDTSLNDACKVALLHLKIAKNGTHTHMQKIAQAFAKLLPVLEKHDVSYNEKLLC